MSDLYLLLTALAILISLFISYRRTRDPLSPLMIFAPMLGYAFCFHVYVVISHPKFSSFLPNTANVEFVLSVHLLSITAFCAGICYYRRSPTDQQQFQILDREASARVRSRFLELGIILGTMACVSFWWMIFSVGGPLKLLYQSKPSFGHNPGYLGEMPMLAFPALFLMAAAWQGQRLNFQRLMLAIYVASTQISMSIIGKRRGTIFITVASLAAFWHIVKNQKPNWKAMIAGVCALGLVLLYIAANRSSGTLLDFGEGSTQRLATTLMHAGDLEGGDEFISAAGVILTSDRFQNHYWGKRFFVTLFIRPIPSFIWPSKWTFFGLNALRTQPGGGGMSKNLWMEAVGYETTGGSATGFLADAFLEWSWGGIIACYCLGRGFGWLWKKWVSRGGVWTVIYAEAMILSIFLPSQSLGAWLYRFLLLSIPTMFAFKLLRVRKTRTIAPSNQPPLRMQSF